MLESLQKDVQQKMRHDEKLSEELDELASKVDAMLERTEGIERIVAGASGKSLVTDHKTGEYNHTDTDL